MIQRYRLHGWLSVCLALMAALIVIGWRAGSSAAQADPAAAAEPTARIDVIPAAASPGAVVQVVVYLVNVVNVYGLQSTCTVDPNVLTGTQPAAGDIFITSNSIGVNKGFNPADGSWLIAASRRKPYPAFSGTGVAFRLNYTVRSTGSSPVNCAILATDSAGKNLPLKIINGSFNGAQPPTTTPTPTQPPATPTATPTQPTPQPQVSTITGTAAYQNRPDNTGITVQLRDASRAVLKEVVTAADGTFRFTDVAAGTYSLKISAPLHLAQVLPVTVAADGQPVDAGAQTLLAGDTNGDNRIDVADASLIGANFGQNVPPAPGSANLNGDAVVDIRDLALVGGNFDQAGPTAND